MERCQGMGTSAAGLAKHMLCCVGPRAGRRAGRELLGCLQKWGHQNWHERGHGCCFYQQRQGTEAPGAASSPAAHGRARLCQLGAARCLA